MKLKNKGVMRAISIVLSVLMIASMLTIFSASAATVSRVQVIFDLDQYPVAGNHPAFAPSPQGSRYTISSVEWTDVAANTVMDFSGTFEADKQYKLTVLVHTTDGNNFPMTSYPTGMFNFGTGANSRDIDTDVTSREGYSSSEYVELSYTFTAEDPVISKVYIDGVTNMYGTLGEGETPASFTGARAVLSNINSNNDLRVGIYEEKWYDITTTPAKEITADTPFEAGHIYDVSVVIEALGSYKFQNDGTHPTLSVKIVKGTTSSGADFITRYGTSDINKFLKIEQNLSVTAGKTTADTVNITKIKVPAAGTAWDMSDIDCTYNSTGGGFELDTSRGRMPGGEGVMGVLTGKGISSIYDSNDSFYTDPLVEGEKYSISIFFKAAPGFEFPAAAEDINIKFDGKTLHPDMIITSGEVFRFTYEFTAAKSDNVIYEVNLKSTFNPKQGDSTSGYGPGNLASYFTTEDTKYTVDTSFDTALYEKESGERVGNNTYFRPIAYTANIKLNAKSGYKFAAKPTFNFTNEGLKETSTNLGVVVADYESALVGIEFKAIGLDYTTGDCTWAFDNVTGTLTISGNGAMEDYVSSEQVPWAPVKDYIKKVVVEDGVTNVGVNAFYGCPNLTEVSLGKDVKTIGDWAFNSCTKLSKVNLPEGLTTIGAQAFIGAVVTEFDVPATVTTIGNKAIGFKNDGTVNENVTIKADYDSAAGKYAKENGIKSELANLKYVIKFDTTGSAYGSGNMADVEVEPGTKYKVPELKDTIMPKADESFDGWKVDGNKVEIGSEIEINKDTVFVATWKENTNVTISINTLIKNKVVEVMPSVTIAKGEKYTVPKFEDTGFELPAGYKFDYWTFDSDKVEAGAEVTVTRSTTLRAVLVEPETKLGDVDGSGEINNADAMLLKRYVAGWENITIVEAAADINGDGVIKNDDAMILKRYVAGWDNEAVTKWFVG